VYYLVAQALENFIDSAGQRRLDSRIGHQFCFKVCNQSSQLNLVKFGETSVGDQLS
jgi:hypothetical protein